MSYFGHDGLSPGDLWVKTGTGWQNVDTLKDNVNRHIRRLGLEKENLHNDLNQIAQESIEERAPTAHRKDNAAPTFLGSPLAPLANYLLIPRGTGKEKGVYFTLGEVMLRLDFAGAVHYPRTVNYVCRLLELMVGSHFLCFSGTAQKNLLYVIGELVNVAIESQQNLWRVRRIISTASEQLKQMRYSHVGTPATWQARMDQLQDMMKELNKVKIKECEEDDRLMMVDLPDDCVRHILCRLGNHEDIINTGTTSVDMNRLCSEPSLWKQLCYFHFTKQQILRETGLGADEKDIRWKGCYQKLYKRYGRKELFADMLHVCSHCNCLYWKDGGHPCSLDTPLERPTQRVIAPNSVISIPLTPQQFLKLFPAPM